MREWQFDGDINPEHTAGKDPTYVAQGPLVTNQPQKSPKTDEKKQNDKGKKPGSDEGEGGGNMPLIPEQLLPGGDPQSSP